jgi:hypothetical protein
MKAPGRCRVARALGYALRYAYWDFFDFFGLAVFVTVVV